MFNAGDAMLHQCTDPQTKSTMYSSSFEIGILDYIKRCSAWQSTPWQMTYGAMWIVPVTGPSNITVGNATLSITPALWNALQSAKTPTSTLILSFYQVAYGYNPFNLTEVINLLTPIADINFYEKQTTGFVNSISVHLQQNSYTLQYAGFSFNSSFNPVCVFWNQMKWTTYGFSLQSTTQYTCAANLTDYSTTPIAVAQNGSFHASCPGGQFWVIQTQQCVNCMAHCAQCLNGTSCISCAQGYNWNSTRSECIAPAQCPAGQYYDSQSGLCYFCMQYCAACSSKNGCTVCDSSAVWSSSLVRCVTRCQSGQFYDYPSHSCLSCKSGCSNCISATGCCTSGIFLY